MAKTIVDLVQGQQQSIIVGQSMLGEEQALDYAEEVRKNIEARAEEQAELEKGGYDYGGKEFWEAVMRRVGRR